MFKLPQNPVCLAATYNPISNTKMISFLVDFPTVLLAELRTHKILSQGSLYEHLELVDFNLSANSARAIPHNKYLEKTMTNPFVPLWTKQQKGMTGDLHKDSLNLTTIWLNSLDYVKIQYNGLLINNAHKQNANRLLAPYAWTTCIISGTEWDNFFNLRCPKYLLVVNDNELYFHSKKEYIDYCDQIGLTVEDSDQFWMSVNKSTAQPEFQVIAELLYDLYQTADWSEDQYHIPFKEVIENKYKEDIEKKVDDKNKEKTYYELLMRVSASMCAKLSYNTQANEDSLDKHLERAQMLIDQHHWEPFSHQAIAMNEYYYNNLYKTVLDKNSFKKVYGVAYNLIGFMSYRYILENYG